MRVGNGHKKRNINGFGMSRRQSKYFLPHASLLSCLNSFNYIPFIPGTRSLALAALTVSYRHLPSLENPWPLMRQGFLVCLLVEQLCVNEAGSRTAISMGYQRNWSGWA